MLYSDVHLVARKMNECAGQNIPFLFAFNFELNEALFVERPMSQNEVLFKTMLGENHVRHNEPIGAVNLDFQVEPFTDYESRFEVVKQALLRGDSFLINLTSKTPVSTNLTLNSIFNNTDAPFKLFVPGRFVCFSPERFVLIREDGTISTNPMKGTIDASSPNAEEVILNDRKEMAEHATVVDLLRNDLSMNAVGVHVVRYRYTSVIQTPGKNILQVSSEIQGSLPCDWKCRVGNIILDMLPAGSVSGAPKKSTVATIRKAEKCERGFYTGVFGYFDGRELDSGVLIRFVEQDPLGNLFFRSGGGITALSDVVKEYDEVRQKIYLPVVEPEFSEVICVRNGEFLFLEYHYNRMAQTVSHFWRTNLILPDLAGMIPDSARRGVYKCRIVYGKEIKSVEFIPYVPRKRNTVALVENDKIDYSYKYTDRGEINRMVSLSGKDDIVIIRNGMVTDSSYCNLVFEDYDGGLFTPKDALLKGTCRQRLLDYGIVVEKQIRRNDLSCYRYVYFINAMMGIDECQKMEVKSIEGL